MSDNSKGYDFERIVAEELERLLLIAVAIILMAILSNFWIEPIMPQSAPSVNTPLLIELPAMNISEIQNRTVIFFDDFEKYKLGYTMNQQNGWFPIWGWSGKIV